MSEGQGIPGTVARTVAALILGGLLLAVSVFAYAITIHLTLYIIEWLGWRKF